MPLPPAAPGEPGPDLCFSFHPQVLWYQTRDSVVVTVKLVNPEEQSCCFYPDRVVYRSGLTWSSKALSSALMFLFADAGVC